MKRSSVAGAVAACAFGLASSACVVTASAPAPRGILVSGPPPAVIREERPPAPVPHAAWIAGYWHWTGVQYAWIPGHWESAPPSGETWHAPEYVQTNGSYFYEPGAWSPAPRAAPSPPPNHPQTAAPNVETFH